MKKMFTLMAAALFAIGVSAQETKTVTYAVQEGDTHKAGETVDVKDGDNTVATLTFGFDGGASFKEAKASTDVEGFVALTEGNGENGKPDSGTCYTIKPKHSGNIEIAVVVNADKAFYVLEDGTALDQYNGVKEAEKYYGTFKFDVKAGKEYKVYCAGSKLGFFGFIYTYDPSTSAENGNNGGNEGNNGGEAQGSRKWDFTKWSDATVANLKADAAASKLEGWSDVEKQADAEADGEPTATSKDNCFWAITTPNEKGELLANSVVIEELKGLVFGTNVNNRGLAIAVNYPEALSVYHGPAYLWLGGANKQFFTIPAVAGGSTIKMGIESHKTSDARGVDLLVNGESIGKFTPTTYEEHTWTIPAGEAVDVVVDNTNGCHIYFIEVSSDPTSIQEVVKVISNGAVYNLAGQKVDENYKGVVIKDGKKMLQK